METVFQINYASMGFLVYVMPETFVAFHSPISFSHHFLASFQCLLNDTDLKSLKETAMALWGLL